MRCFQTEFKINFVDHQNNFAGFDIEEQCCERFGFRVIIEGNEIDESVLNNVLGPFSFTGQVIEQYDEEDELEPSNQVEFEITSGEQTGKIVFYCCHNGYYAHVAEFNHNTYVL